MISVPEKKKKRKLPYGMHSIDITSATWKSSIFSPLPSQKGTNIKPSYLNFFKFTLCCILSCTYLK